jgi:hypothetical protein
MDRGSPWPPRTGLARIWALDIDDLLGIATERLTRSLTDEQCRQFLHVENCSSSEA